MKVQMGEIEKRADGYHFTIDMGPCESEDMATLLHLAFKMKLQTMLPTQAPQTDPPTLGVSVSDHITMTERVG